MGDGFEPGDGALERLKCRDEILQVLFWLAGEGFERDMTVEGVARFIGRPADEVGPVMRGAIDAGLVAAAAGDRYELTPAGRREGGRRFTEEFAEIFARDAHGGACSDPTCDCHDAPGGPAACTRHEHAHR